MAFYSIGDNSFYKRGFPWITGLFGMGYAPRCPECRSERPYFKGPFEARMEFQKGSKWPDMLGCGGPVVMIVSDRTVEAWKREKVGTTPVFPVKIVSKLPKKLQGTKPPDYFVVDGTQLVGAELDHSASGFVGVEKCGQCGAINYDIGATYDKRHASVHPYAFVAGSWNGANFFTTSWSQYLFFCTEELIRVARDYRLSNFRFTPVEDGDAIGNKGIDYLKK